MNLIKSVLRFLKLIIFLTIFYIVLGSVFKFIQDIKWYWSILLSGVLIGLVYASAEMLIDFSREITNNNKLNGILFTLTNGIFCVGILYNMWSKILNSNDTGLFVGSIIFTIVYLLISIILSLFAFSD